MFFQQKYLCSSQTRIEDIPKRTSKRQSRKNYQFKIQNPLFSGKPINSNVFVPNLPTHIKNQLIQSNYLSYEIVNSLNPSQCVQNTVNRRTSRFSKRLMAMRNALKFQELKMQNSNIQNEMQNEFVSKGDDTFGLMEEQECSMKLQYLQDDMMERQNSLQLQIQCGLMQKQTQIQYYSENEMPYINYDQYETYLDV